MKKQTPATKMSQEISRMKPQISQLQYRKNNRHV